FSIVIVAQAGDNINHPALLIVNNAIGFVNAAAPPAAQISPQRLRLTDPLIGASLNILDQCVYPFQRLFVLRLPIQILAPRPILPQQPHQSTSIKSCSAKWALPVFTSCMTLSRCRRLLSE